MKKQLENSGMANLLRIIPISTAVLASAIFFFTGAQTRSDEVQQQAWLISTRRAPLSGDLQSGLEQIRYWRLSDDQQWQPSDADSFHAQDKAELPTTIIIHGNNRDADEAIDFAWPIYHQMLKAAPDQPFRVVIWSWASDRVYRRNRPDVQLKFCYCDAQAYYLGDCLRRIRPETPVSMLGYSMGARIILGGLQLLAGGEVACRTLSSDSTSPESQQRNAPIKVLLVAAAVDDDCLATDGRYNLALPQVQSLLIVRNGRDRVLKWYPRTYGRGGPDALGYVGPTGCTPGDKTEILDLTCDVGRIHKWDDYLASCRLWDALERYALFPAIPDPQK